MSGAGGYDAGYTMVQFPQNDALEDRMNITRRTLLKSMTALLIPASALDARAAAPGTSYVLNRFSVAGFQFYHGPKLLGRMKPGDVLQLCAEPENPYDEFAVRILWKGSMLGHVPRSDNRHISRLLQQGAPVSGRIMRIRPQAPAWNQLKVEVGLGG